MDRCDGPTASRRLGRLPLPPAPTGQDVKGRDAETTPQAQEAQRYRELQEQYRQLQEVHRLQESLMQMVIHDLRTPLTSLLSGLVTVESLGGLSEDHHDVLAVAIQGGQTLLGMVNDLLAISKMESGKLAVAREEVLPEELIRSAISQVKSLAAGEGVEILSQLEPDLPLLYADLGLIVRTLVNLLGNALKFTPAGGTVTVTAHQSDDGTGILFAVADTGADIPQEALGRIFDKFAQVPGSGGRRAASTGLGLTFCKMAVEAHGGRIWAESRPGQGSRLSFVIPLQQETSGGH